MLQQFDSIDRILHALAEPTRRRMVERLSDGPVSVSALGEPFDMSLAAVLQHVQVLEAAGVVRTAKIGRVRTCQLDLSAMRATEQWMRDRRATLEQQFDRLGAFLDATHGPSSSDSELP
ncbi:MAG: helix-turn-helix transcriptional regulator [Gemmatimonadaceae bacterium]|nr:helix-turn-helix transcriptional regulator [Gemmatimonadaceae bacterium]